MPRRAGAGRSFREAYGSSSSSIALATATALAIGIAGGVCQAQTVIESSDTTQTLSTDTAYILDQGTTVSSKKNDAIIVNGIAPAGFTNAGSIANGNDPATELTSQPLSAIRFNVDGGLVNQTTGAIFGNDRGVFIDGAGLSTIVNYGDISAKKGPGIEFGSRSSGVVDNFGTINNGNSGLLTGASRGIGIDTSGTVTINNHAGGSIKSGSGPSPTAITVQSGDHLITNEGLIEAHRVGIEVTGGSVQITNRGTISAKTGTAISLESSNNRLTLDTGSILNGSATSSAAGNHLRLRGSGVEDSPMTGFADLTMDGAAWILSGELRMEGRDPATIDVRTGTLTLAGALTTGVGGGATIARDAGLSIGAGGDSGGFTGPVVDDGVLTFNRSDDLTFSSVVRGLGSVVKLGAGTTTLSGPNSYSGGTRLEDGVLSVSSDGNLGNAAGELTFDGGTLRMAEAFTSARAITVASGGGAIDVAGPGATFTGLVRGAYPLRKAGQRTLTLTADSTAYTGSLTIEAGIVQLGAGGSTGTIAGDVINAGGLVFNRATDLVFGGAIGGGGTISKQGGNRLTLSGSVGSTAALARAVEVRTGVMIVTGALETSGSGRTTVASGATLAIGDGGATGRLVGDVNNDGALAFNRATDLTYQGGIAGSGTVAKQGAGTLTLLGDVASTGGVVISGGALRLGDGGERGAIDGGVVNNATLIFNRSDSFTYAGVISGSGAVTQQGSGTTTLTGINSHTGLTSVDAGRLDIADTGVVAGPVRVAASATLGGRGGIGGGVTVVADGHVAPGSSIGTLTMGSLVLEPGSRLDYELGLPDIVGGKVNDHIIVNGALTLDGVLDIVDEGGFSQGVYQLIHYGGALTNNGLDIGGLPGRFRTGQGVVVSTATPGEVNLIVSSGGFGLQFWDGAGLSGNNAVEGGSGAWNPTTPNWTVDDGSVNAPWQQGFAVFQGAPGTVTLGGDMTFQGMQFRTDGYVIQGGAFALASAADSIINLDPGVTTRIDAPITDAPGMVTPLIKEGDGTLIFSGLNTYAGGTIIDQGTLSVAIDANLGAAAGGVTIDGATLRLGDGFTSARTVALDFEGGTVETAGVVATLTGAITGPGGLVKTGAGRLLLEGSGNSYAGGTVINAGVLSVAADGLLGGAGHGVTFGGGALDVGGGFTTARALTLEDGGGALDASGPSATFTGLISGPGGLTKGPSANTIILTGDNSYAGGTTISGGVLQLGDGGVTGSIVGRVVNDGTLIFNRGDAYQVANDISGAGGIQIVGGGVAHLLGTSIYKGQTRITGLPEPGHGSTLIADSRANMGEYGAGSAVVMGLDSTLVLTTSFEFFLPFTIQDTTQTIDTSGEAVDTTISGLIGGGGELRKAGAGTLILINDANSYAGGTRIDEGVLSVLTDGALGTGTSGLALAGGVLRVGDGFATARAVTLDAAGGTIETVGWAAFAGAISGPGALSKAGLGEVALEGAGNSFAGGVFVNAGRLTVAADNLLGDGAGGLTLDGGVLRVGDGFDSARAVTLKDGGGTLDIGLSSAAFTGVISGPGHLTKTGGSAGLITLTADNTFTGGVTIESGVLQIGDFGGTTGAILGDVLDEGVLQFGRSDAYGIANNISGTGVVTIRNGGIATLTGHNSFTGDLKVLSGTVIAEDNTNLGSAAGAIRLDASSQLVLAGAFEITRRIAFDGALPAIIDTREHIVVASGVVSGSLPLVKEGVGTLILTNTNSRVGGADINAGTLQIGGGGATGTLNGDVTIAAGATLVFDRAGPVTFGNVTGPGSRTDFGKTISGAGSVVQAGPGTLIAVGDHTFLGGTLVEQGRFLINGATLGPTDVAIGARLGGTGSIAGRVTIADGAFLEPGDSPGTLTVGALVLGSGSVLNYELGLPDIVGGGVNDLTVVTGDLTLDGTLNIADAGGFSRGVYRLIDYGGVLADNGLAIAGLPSRFVPGDMLISTATAGQVNLIVSAGGLGLRFWDGSNAVGNGLVDGGAATWNNATTNWTAADGVVNTPWQGGFAVFQGAAGVVTLGEPIAFEGLQFRTDGYAIEGGGFGLAAAPDTIIRVDASVTAAIDAPIVDGSGGPARLTVIGPGLLSLGGFNSYSGGTIVDGGALRIGADANLGAVNGALVLDGGSLLTTASFSSGRAISLGEEGGVFAIGGGTQLALSGAIGGAGTLGKTGAGVLVLSGANSYAGGAFVGAGVLAVSADVNLGAAGGALDLGGGTLRFDASFDLAAGRPVSLTSASGVIDTNGHDVVFATAVVGAGALSKIGAGTLTLTGDNAYSGGTTISGGALQIGDGGATGGVLGAVTNNAALIFNRSDAVTFGEVITGGGSLTKLGAGTLTLTGANAYAGGTTIGAGTLRVGDGASGGGIIGDIVDNAALVFDRADPVTFAGAISGVGTVAQVGGGTLTLGGINTHSGGTTARTGTIAVSSDLNLGASGASLTLDDGTLLTTAAISSARPITLASAGGAIDNGGFSDLLSGRISGPGALTVTGAGTVTLTAENDYAGGTTINGATLRLGDGGTTGGVVGDVVNNGTLIFARSDRALFEGMVSGGGSLVQAGAGATVLTASNSHTGGTTISAGALWIGNGGTSGAIVGDVDNASLLIFDRADSLVYGGVVSGGGALRQVGAGTTVLTGANSYSGGTTINAGALEIGDGGTAGSLAGDVVDNGVLAFNRADAVAFSGMVSGIGSLSQVGAGTLTLSGVNAHTGGTAVSAGTLAVSNDLNLGAPTAMLTLDGGRLLTTAGLVSQRAVRLGAGGGTIDTGGFASLFSGPITGPGALRLAGGGMVTLAGDNTHAGGTTIASGALRLGDGATTGGVLGDVVNDGALVFDRSNVLVFDGVISGAGAVVQRGGGTTTLTAMNSYAGPTSVDSGRLLVDGAIGGSATVASGARLGGSGVIGGVVTIADGGHLAPGDSPGTLTVGALVLGPGSWLDYELGLPDIVGAGVSDLTIVRGGLTLDGALNLANAGGLGLGVYRLIDYGGALIDNGLVLGAAPSGLSASDLEISTATPGEVNLIVSQGGPGLQFWDGSDTVGNGVVDGGAAIWSAAGTNWTTADGAANAAWKGGFAIFQGVGGAVTLGEPIAFEGIQFRTTDYRIEGGGLGLTAVGATIIRVDPSRTATIDTPITGAATLTKGGGGLLVLGGANSYSGGTAIKGGTIRIDADVNLGAASGGLALDLGTLETTATLATSRLVTLGEGGGVFSVDAGAQLTLDGAVTGAGRLGKTGGGTLVLTGLNSHAGGTIVEAGALVVSLDGNLGAVAGPLVLDGGTLRLGASFDPAATRPIDLDGAGGTIDTGGYVSTFAQGIGGTGALTKQGDGVLTLAGANSYGGGTTIRAGVLRVGDGATAGSLVGDIVDNGALVFDRADQLVHTGAISGAGSLTQAGTGTTVLTGANSYRGGTMISAGALQIGNGGTLGGIGGDVVDNGALVFNRSDPTTFGGAVSGGGALRQEGGGVLTLSGASRYTGPTTVTRGRLDVAGSLGDTAVAVASGATLSGGGSIAGPVTIDAGARLAPGPLAAPGTLSVGALSLAHGARLTWRLGRPDVVGGRLNDRVVVTGDLRLDGRLDIAPASDFGALPGAYRLIDYGGVLTDGGLALGLLPDRFAASQVQTAIPGQVNLIAVRDGLAVQFWDGGDGLGDGRINGGSGAWTVASTNWTASNGAINQQWLSGMAIFAAPGGEVVLGGDVDAIALQFVGDGYRIQGAGHVLTFLPHASGHGGLVRVDPESAAEIAAVIAGTAGLTKSDAGTLILTGANTYSGGTAIRDGTLQIGAGGTGGGIGGDVANDGRLVFDRSDGVTFAGTISGLGAVEQHGGGVLSLTGANSYSGGTSVRAGVLQIARDANIGGETGGLLVDAGTLRWMAAFDLAATRPITLGAGGGRFDTNGFNSTISQGVGGAGGLAKFGAGRLTLAGQSDYAGATSIVAGELSVNGSIRSATTVGAEGALSGRGVIFGKVVNHGRIAPGNSIGTLTISGDYAGDGGALEIETVLGADDSPSDRLVIAGGAATGSTTVHVLNLGGEGGLTAGDGILVVDAAGGATTAADAFRLAAPVLAGPYEYLLVRGGVTGSTADDWFLRSTTEEETPSYRPETSLYATLPALALTYGRSLIGTLHERAGDMGGAQAGRDDDKAVWSRVLLRDGEREGKNGILGGGPRYDYDYYAVQMGVDLVHDGGGKGGQFAGLYAAYGSGDGEVRHFTRVQAGKDRFNAYTLGAYWTRYAPTGWYLDGVVQGSRYDMKAQSVRLGTVSTDGFGFAGSIEGGRALRTGGVTVEPQAQLMFQAVSLDDVADMAAQVRFEDMNSLAGRVGARVAKTWARGDEGGVTLWGRTSLWYEFMGDTKAAFSSAAGFVPLHAHLGGEWVEFDGGVTADLTGRLSVHANVRYETDFEGRQHSYGLQAGLRLRW
jgi:fibronectin-binding autotransporter adhesin